MRAATGSTAVTTAYAASIASPLTSSSMATSGSLMSSLAGAGTPCYSDNNCNKKHHNHLISYRYHRSNDRHDTAQ
jgi:hypothetical protein